MPPLRTFTPIKAIKTERTHEENQERAYIAASRRSDRSLEARVESARRASEIHKRRTGRSLKVTEQDVINEEMYEEEDDDLPSQYRRLTAHLQTGSADFNRRLAAYLTNNVAMRSALDQAITSSYAQQFPNAPRFAHNNPSLFPSPLLTHGTMDPTQGMPQQESPSSPHSYRSSPYPMPGMPGYRQQMAHNRAGSMSVGDQKPVMSPTMSIADRRMSMSTAKPTPSDRETSSKSPEISRDTLKSPKDNGKRSHDDAFEQFQQSIGPLTTTLPGDSQQLLGSTLDMSDPFNSMLMGNMGGQQNFMDNSFYGYPGKESNFYPNLDGMNSTLAPKVTLSAQQSFDGASAHPHGSFNLDFSNLKGVDFNASDSSSGKGSAHATPGVDGGWDAFINDNSWAENAT